MNVLPVPVSVTVLVPPDRLMTSLAPLMNSMLVPAVAATDTSL